MKALLLILLIFLGCFTLDPELEILDRGPQKLSSLQPNLPANRFLEQSAKNSPQITKMLGVYGKPEKIDLRSESGETILSLMYRDQDMLKFKRNFLSWEKIEAEKFKLPEWLTKDFYYTADQDTSWEDISEEYTGSRKNWKRLRYINKSQNLKVYQGQKVRIPAYLYKEV